MNVQKRLKKLILQAGQEEMRFSAFLRLLARLSSCIQGSVKIRVLELPGYQTYLVFFAAHGPLLPRISADTNELFPDGSFRFLSWPVVWTWQLPTKVGFFTTLRIVVSNSFSKLTPGSKLMEK